MLVYDSVCQLITKLCIIKLRKATIDKYDVRADTSFAYLRQGSYLLVNRIQVLINCFLN